MPSFDFDPKTFVQPAYEKADGDWSTATLAQIERLRALYPELEQWGALAVGCAFGEFSQDFLLVSWADWMIEERDELFLCYCYWRQTQGKWQAGFNEELLQTATGWKD